MDIMGRAGRVKQPEPYTRDDALGDFVTAIWEMTNPEERDESLVQAIGVIRKKLRIKRTPEERLDKLEKEILAIKSFCGGTPAYKCWNADGSPKY